MIAGSLWAAVLLSSPTYTPPNQVRVRQGDTFASIAERFDTGYMRLQAANPGLVPERIRPGDVVVIPARYREAARTAATTPSNPNLYVVRNGDTDWSIARRFSMRPSELRELNPGVEWTRLQIGAKLRVKVGAPAATPAPEAEMTVAASRPAARPATSGARHTVREGENDWVIARKYGVRPSDLRAANPGVEWTALQVGTELKLPAGTRSAAATTARIDTKRVRIHRDNVVVRARPSTSADRVTMVEVGRVASIIDREADWYRVRFSGGTSGWVRGDLLTPVSASEFARINARELAVARRNGASASTRVASNSGSASSSTRRSTSSSSTRTNRTSSGGTRVAAMSPGTAGSLLDTARSSLGIRYRWGGTSRGGFDCSGFVQYTYRQHGVRLPRTSREQATVGAAVSKDNLAAGDLVFFKTNRGTRINHVGIYMGGGRFIHASSGGGRVRIDTIESGYYQRRYAGARRVTGARATSAPAARAPKSETVSRREERPTTPRPTAPANTAPAPAAPVAAPPRVVPGTDATGR